MRVFGTNVDVSLGGAGRDGSNRHAFDQHERVALHRHAVGVGAGVAFVGITHNVFLVSLQTRYGFPFDAGRKRRTATPAQAGVQHLLHHIGSRQRQRTAQPGITLMRLVIGQRQRVGDTHARKGEAFLPTQIRNVFRQAEA